MYDDDDDDKNYVMMMTTLVSLQTYSDEALPILPLLGPAHKETAPPPPHTHFGPLLNWFSIFF